MDSAEQAKALIQAIQAEAQARWGDAWIASLVRAYCEIESLETGKEVKPPQRRSQIGRIFEEYNTTLQTILRLVQAIDGKLSLEVVRREKLF